MLTKYDDYRCLQIMVTHDLRLVQMVITESDYGQLYK